MTKESIFTALRIIAEIIAAVVITLLGVGLFCRLAGWRTYYQYGTVLIWFAIAIGGMGFFTYLGNRGSRRSLSKWTTQTTSWGGTYKSNDQPNDNVIKLHRPAIIMLISGVILFIVGSQVQGLP
jgi:hypothetical protein